MKSFSLTHTFDAYALSIWKTEKGTGDVGTRIMPDTEVLANHFANFIGKEYVRIFPAWIENTFCVCFCLLLSYFCFSLRTPKDVVWTAVVLVLGNLLPFFAFFFGDWLLPSVPNLVASLVVPYICLPITLFRLMQKRSMEKVETEQKAEKLRHESQIAVRSAEADAVFRLATRVAHDIRSPLSALQIVSSTIQIEDVKSQLMNRSIDRLEQISSSLLQTYRTTGKFGDRQTPVCRIRGLTTNIEDHCKRVFPEISFSLSNSASVDYVTCSAAELERHLFNLVTNAIESLKSSATENPSIRFEVLSEQSKIQFRVADNGPGVDSAIRENLFLERATYGKAMGTGLGLASARNFFSSLNGSIILEETSIGASFLVEIPTQQTSETIQVEGFLIVADDDEDVVNLLAKQVADLQDKLATTDPREAQLKIRELLNTKKSFTILCDLVFQGSDLLGFDLLNEIPGSPAVKIEKILYTTLASETQIQEICRKAGIRLIDKKSVPILDIYTAS